MLAVALAIGVAAVSGLILDQVTTANGRRWRKGS